MNLCILAKKNPAIRDQIVWLEKWMKNLGEPEYMYRLTRTFNEDKQRMEVTNREKSKSRNMIN
jgi:hypothetical protein